MALHCCTSETCYYCNSSQPYWDNQHGLIVNGEENQYTVTHWKDVLFREMGPEWNVLELRQQKISDLNFLCNIYNCDYLFFYSVEYQHEWESLMNHVDFTSKFKCISNSLNNELHFYSKDITPDAADDVVEKAVKKGISYHLAEIWMLPGSWQYGPQQKDKIIATVKKNKCVRFTLIKKLKPIVWG